MSKRKIPRRQMQAVEDDDHAGLQDVSSDGEDDNYEAKLTDNDTAATGAAAARRPSKRRARDPSEKPPLMEGEGKHLRVLGFNRSQRALFIQLIKRYGTGNYDWAEFIPRLKKSYTEINDYANLFARHMCELINDSPTFADGVPKEGLKIEDVLVRLGTLSLIRDKLQALEKGSVFFTEDILSLYPGLKGGRFWKEHHDRVLLQALTKHGYRRWQQIVDDKDLKIQEVICQELNLPSINAPVPGAPLVHTFFSPGTSRAPSQPSETSQAQSSTSGVPLAHGPNPGVSQPQNGADVGHVEAPGHQTKRLDVAHGATDTIARRQLFQDPAGHHHYREMQRRLVNFVKKRVQLLEKGLHIELQKEYFANEKAYDVPVYAPEYTGVRTAVMPHSAASFAERSDPLPQVEPIASEEMQSFACDESSDRFEMARVYNETGKIVMDDGEVVDKAHDISASSNFSRNLGSIEVLNQEINQILSPVQHSGENVGGYRFNL